MEAGGGTRPGTGLCACVCEAVDDRYICKQRDRKRMTYESTVWETY